MRENVSTPAGVQENRLTMPSTHTSLHYHIVFGTKNREPSIQKEWRLRLHEYLGGVVRGLDGIAEIIGGVDDHVHILASLNATHRLSDFMRELKRNSSIWVHDTLGFREFAWQDGYSAFTVGHTQLRDVKRYIANQKEHHKKVLFEDEMRGFYRKYEVPFDEQYVWD